MTTGIGPTGKRGKGIPRLSDRPGPHGPGNKGLNFLSNKLIPNEYLNFDPRMKQCPLTSSTNNENAMVKNGGVEGVPNMSSEYGFTFRGGGGEETFLTSPQPRSSRGWREGKYPAIVSRISAPQRKVSVVITGAMPPTMVTVAQGGSWRLPTSVATVSPSIKEGGTGKRGGSVATGPKEDGGRRRSIRDTEEQGSSAILPA